VTAALRHRSIYLLLSAGVILVDQWTKWLIRENLRIYWDSIEVIPGLFNIVHVRNTGAAFGIGARSESALVPVLLNFGAIAVFIFVLIYAFRAATTDRVLQTGLHLILGGAIGNLIDRFTLGSVVDFLDVFITVGGVERHWPAFNVADSAICIGIGLLFLDMWRRPPEAAPEKKTVA
jgi:signal peptidase II